MKDLLKQGRTPRSWRVLRQFGSSMLEQGASPDEAALKVKELVTAAKAQARAAALEAKVRRRQERIDLMLEQIAGGRERDAAVFEARALGAALEDIGRAIGVTRERVRQICDHYASRRRPIEWLRIARRRPAPMVEAEQGWIDGRTQTIDDAGAVGEAASRRQRPQIAENRRRRAWLTWPPSTNASPCSTRSSTR